MKNRIDLRHVHHALASLLMLTALVMALNAWTYSYANGIPLVQADAWVFLDTYVRKYLEGGFGWRDIFLQTQSSDTNLPLHKLVLMLHINLFHMDFKVEGLVGVVAGMALVLVLTVAAAGADPSRWRLASFGLLAGLAMVLLSLNSSNVYSWPLVTMWFLNLLIVALYLVFMARPVMGAAMALAGTLLMALLLDEVALITVVAAVAALLVQADARPLRERLLQGAGAISGLLIVRAAYWAFNTAQGVVDPPTSSTGLLHNLIGLITSEGLRLVFIPLGDSLVHPEALTKWFPANHAAAGSLIAAVLGLAHLWFWWRVFKGRRECPDPAIRTRRVAIALMLFFYGTVAGIALQRIPEFGIDYLHQPRYVIFYQLNLAALAMLVYSEFGRRFPPGSRSQWVGAPLLFGLLALGVLQWHLSQRSWEQAKYLSVYVEGTALTMGQLAANPDAQIQCADILRVCDFPPAKRKQLMHLLKNYRLNIFNEDFQAFYRLRPYPLPVIAAPAKPAPPPNSPVLGR